jgi:hypothetical protein
MMWICRRGRVSILEILLFFMIDYLNPGMSWMRRVIVMLIVAYMIVGCATHIAASNQGGSVTESINLKW